ncbi:MAG: hypothetical protein LC797_19365, partial [Chloroflexi bacterium]|nr:hypothetical protein [Chloroflexota bacterium]
MAQTFRARVRMYRHGLGDCFLVTLPRRDGSNYFIMIDCGVVLGTADPNTKMAEVVANIVATTGGHVDLLAATHAHWDHISGFTQAADALKQLSFGQVWLAWTEDPTDSLANTLGHERAQALNGLRLSANHLRLAGDDEHAAMIGSLLEFFGATGGPSTNDALDAIRQKVASPRYCRPQDPPVELTDPDVRLYVLGPPRDETLIRMALPTSNHPGTSTYSMALDRFLNDVAAALGTTVPDSPFGAQFAIPMPAAQAMDFFARHYWGADAWRRIDGAWLEGSPQLALQLDSATNNTSLVLGIELGNGDVLLFAGDAQVGNWISWQDLRWTVGSRTVTGPDLLRRTIVYKVGHHGSYNATLREKGLEMMDSLQTALVPVDHDMAVKKNWGKIPLPSLLDALTAKTKGAVVRADQPGPTVLAPHLVEDKL